MTWIRVHRLDSTNSIFSEIFFLKKSMEFSELSMMPSKIGWSKRIFCEILIKGIFIEMYVQFAFRLIQSKQLISTSKRTCWCNRKISKFPGKEPVQFDARILKFSGNSSGLSVLSLIYSGTQMRQYSALAYNDLGFTEFSNFNFLEYR